ncbi:hypothetical protein [Xanthobacter versatilis]|uniref:hypothetical protein n=1 Tax=Xanthobacter autotrophicus (strain ATCC BAA-1158 / Py2) TaxID=78245 RepID=UPI00372A5665
MERRDYFILPLIVIATVLAVAVPVEAALRIFFPYSEADRCVVYGDPRPSAFHATPNCSSRIKVPEGPWVDMKYNACGYRSTDPCTPKKPESLRLAVIGSSLAAGYLVPYDESVSARARESLTTLCRLPVDVQNLGAEGNMGVRLTASAEAAAALTPDAIVLVVSPTDLVLDNAMDQAAPAPGAVAKHQAGWIQEFKAQLSRSRLLYMESYLLLRNDDNYVPIYRRSGHKADFMRLPLSEDWQARLAHLDRDISRVRAAIGPGIPLIILFAPERAQAAMLAVPHLAKGMAPAYLQSEIARRAQAHGAYFADMSPLIPPGTPSSDIYYAMNGHLNGEGHALLAEALVGGLFNAHIPAFTSACTAPSATAELNPG